MGQKVNLSKSIYIWFICWSFVNQSMLWLEIDFHVPALLLGWCDNFSSFEFGINPKWTIWLLSVFDCGHWNNRVVIIFNGKSFFPAILWLSIRNHIPLTVLVLFSVQLIIADLIKTQIGNCEWHIKSYSMFGVEANEWKMNYPFPLPF